MARRAGGNDPITLRVRTSRKATEALRLQIRRLADRLGVPPIAVQIRPVTDPPPGESSRKPIPARSRRAAAPHP